MAASSVCYFNETDGRGRSMELDYKQIGRRIARRRKFLGLKQAEVEERADIGFKYLSVIERGFSIPSTEVIMRLAVALETTPDEFLVGSTRRENERWRDVADSLRALNNRQLALVSSFIEWVGQQEIP
ncbi:MAG: helix-turn-helix transcriptional regulator [Oscillospiraceae bacterium]|nr:helix-turn-helix transcriptional regulator [Oscillospiraceae bacterium]